MSGRPFRLFGHPPHPVFVHVPLGLLPAATLWAIVAVLGGGEAFWIVSFWTLVLGLIGAFPAALTGLIDLRTLDDEKAASVALVHACAMLGAVAAYTGSAFSRGGPVPATAVRGFVALGIELVGLLVLGVGGWLGGELVHRHGAGRTPSPRS